MQSNNISKEIARNCYSWCCLPPFTALFCFFLSQETLMMQRLWAPRCSPPPLHRYHPLSKRHRPRRPRLPLSTPAFVLTGKMCCLLEGNYIKFFFTNVLVNQSNVSAQSLKLNVWARRYFIFWDSTQSLRAKLAHCKKLYATQSLWGVPAFRFKATDANSLQKSVTFYDLYVYSTAVYLSFICFI